MAVSLKKGQRVSLEKVAQAKLSGLMVGLGWDEAKGSFWRRLTLESIDLDASCLCFNQAGELVDRVWFRALVSKDRAVKHSGDNLTGAGEGDDEQLLLALDKLDKRVTELVFTVTSFRGQTFDRIANAFCRVVDLDTGKELVRYDLAGGGQHTAMIVARLTLVNGDWQVEALGQPAEGRVCEQLVPAVRALLGGSFTRA